MTTNSIWYNIYKMHTKLLQMLSSVYKYVFRCMYLSLIMCLCDFSAPCGRGIGAPLQ